MTTHELIERQFERLREIETALANGADYADDPQCHPLYPHAVAARQILEKHIATLTDEVEGLRAALTPSAETKAAYIGEFKFSVRDGYDEQDEEVFRDVLVPWDTIKEIMAAIRARATLTKAEGPGQ